MKIGANTNAKIGEGYQRIRSIPARSIARRKCQFENSIYRFKPNEIQFCFDWGINDYLLKIFKSAEGRKTMIKIYDSFLILWFFKIFQLNWFKFQTNLCLWIILFDFVFKTSRSWEFLSASKRCKSDEHRMNRGVKNGDEISG